MLTRLQFHQLHKLLTTHTHSFIALFIFNIPNDSDTVESSDKKLTLLRKQLLKTTQVIYSQ